MPQVDQNIKEKMLFIKKFVAEPRMIGSITPSSPQLVASMLCNVDWDKIGCIAEFGAGTGVVTKAIMKNKLPQSRLFVFEIEDDLRQKLIRDTGLPHVLREERLRKVDLIVSGLPYAVLPQEVTAAVLDGISRTLAEDGMFVAFQYSLHMKSAFERIFKEVKIRFVMMNIPPAFVYECRGLKG